MNLSSRRKIVGIYKITSPSGKVYIGQSWDIRQRLKYYKAGHCKGQLKIHNSLLKYSFNAHSFEIIYELPSDTTQSVLDEFETFFIQQFTEAGIEMLNIRPGGLSSRPAPESCAKMVETRRKKGSYAWSDEQRRAQSERQKGKCSIVMTAEVIAKVAAAQRGRKHTADHVEKNRQAQIGRIHSEETKRKIGASNIGRKRPDLAERNIASKKGKPGTKWSAERHAKHEKWLSDPANSRKGIMLGKRTAEQKANQSAAITEWWKKRKEVVC